MRGMTKLTALLFVVGAIALLVWWLFYASYIREIKNLPKEMTSENYFQFFDALAHLPTTEMPLANYPHPKLDGGANISSVWWAERSAASNLVFANVHRASETEARSASISVTFL